MVACVFVTECLCIGEEPNDVADKFLGLLQPRLWQRNRRGLFMRREISDQADTLAPL